MALRDIENEGYIIIYILYSMYVMNHLIYN